MKQGLTPILWPDSRILILGSLPGDESLRLQQYYGHPRNQFWTIVSAVFGAASAADYDSRLALLKQHRIALWDVIQRAERRGSSDGSIRNAAANDFSRLFECTPALRTIAFNGGTSARLFERDVRPRIDPQRLQCLQLIALPSTSPIPGRNVLTLAEKIERWRAITQA